MHIHMYAYICVYMYIHIYLSIYIERERKSWVKLGIQQVSPKLIFTVSIIQGSGRDESVNDHIAVWTRMLVTSDDMVTTV